MNLNQILALLIIASFYLAYFAKMFFQRQKGIKTHQIAKGKKSAQTLLVEKFLGFATLAIVPLELISLIRPTYPNENSYLQITGLIIASLGVIVFIVAMMTMKDSWRAGINEMEKTRLVTTGIYQYSRNPAFLGFDLLYLGILVAYFNVYLFFFTLFTITTLHLQILQEEKYLLKTFSTTYYQYQKQVGRYFIFL